MTEVVLSLRGVSKWYVGLHALTDVDMDCMKGERIAIIGPNGAGKTTLFNVITGERPVTSGKIILFGEDVTKKSIRRRVSLGLSRTYQSTLVFDKLTVKQNIALSLFGLASGLGMLGSANKFITCSDRINEVTESVDLQDRIDSIAGGLSHGEKRQLEIGLSISCMPRIILFDEPAAGLSPKERLLVIELIKSLPDDITVLLVEHDMEVALSVAKRVIVLHEGRIIATGIPEEIIANKMVQDIYLGGKLDE
jgi:branched-chain amino acid transport system ATP-binding protein